MWHKVIAWWAGYLVAYQSGTERHSGRRLCHHSGNGPETESDERGADADYSARSHWRHPFRSVVECYSDIVGRDAQPEGDRTRYGERQRLPGATADIKIVRGQRDATSDLRVSWQQGNPARLSLGLDDSGSKSTGRYLGSATLALDAPLLTTTCSMPTWVKICPDAARAVTVFIPCITSSPLATGAFPPTTTTTTGTRISPARTRC